MERKKVTVPDLLQMKREGRKITKVNLHDYPTAVLADRAGIDIVMIGDSIGMVVLGYANTIPVTMEEMIHHAKVVVRGAKNSLVVCDMPFMSYQTSLDEAVGNAGRLLKETGVDAVKLEGGAEIKKSDLPGKEIHRVPNRKPGERTEEARRESPKIQILEYDSGFGVPCRKESIDNP